MLLRGGLARLLAGSGFAWILLLGGCASAPAAHQAAARPAVTSAATSGGAVRLTDYTNNDGPASTVVLTGAIGDYGKAVGVHPDGTVDPQHSSQLKLALTRGSFRIVIAGIDRQLVARFRNFPPDRRTCSGIVRAAGPAPVVAGSGTGAYRGISGRFDLAIMIAEVDARGHCGPSSAFLSQAVIMTGTGTVAHLG